MDGPLLVQEPFRAIFYAPIYAALARCGSLARLVEGSAADAALRAVRSGQVDMAWGGPMRLILEHAADPASPLRGFAPVVGRDPFLLVGRGRNDGFRLADLATLRAGIVSEVPTPWWCLQDDMRRAGLDPAAMHRHRGGTMARNVADMLAGRLDVAQVHEPFAAEAEQAGAAVWHAAADRGPTAYTVFYGMAAHLQARARAVEAFVAVVRETLAWIRNAPSAALAGLVAPLFPQVAPHILHRALDRYEASGIWTDGRDFETGAIGRLDSAMVSAGVIGHPVPAGRYMLNGSMGICEDGAAPGP